MPLTRHLYKEDEVLSSLMLSCLRGRVEEAAFWGLELLDSAMADEMILALRRIWLWGFGVGAAGWILGFEDAVKGEELEADTLLRWAVGLARLGGARQQDISVAALVVLSWGATAAEGSRQPDRVNGSKRGSGAASTGNTPLEQCIELALQQGKTLTAWTAFRGWESGEQGGIAMLKRAAGGEEGHLAAFLDCLAAMEDVELLPRQAAALAAVCHRALRGHCLLPSVAPPLEGGLAAKVEVWRGLYGRRARRALSIPFDALPWLTERGRCLSVYDSNEKELYRLERPTGLWGSQIWDEFAEEVGGWEAIRQGGESSDAAAREAFYDTHFPDDIPDEWSRADRAKSHGGGVLQKGVLQGKPDAARWFRTWFAPYPSAVIWEGAKLALAALAASSQQMADAAAFWKGCAVTPQLNEWNFAPVTKRIFVTI
jgi:hypothetical protein